MKEQLQAHLEANTSLPTTSDYLFHLTCNEALSTDNLADDFSGARTMTQTGAPGLSGSAARNNPTTGARTFNGTTQYAGRAASDSDHTVLQGEYGFAFWCYRENATSVVLEYGEWSSPETQATNIQMSARVFNGSLSLQWERGAGASFDSGALVSIPLNVWCHVGVAVRVDAGEPGFRQFEGFLNGERVSRTWGGFLPPDGGTSSRWIVGASRDRGTAVGTPGQFFQGGLDDIIVTRWAPDEAWFRAQYARGARDWSKRVTSHTSTHVRVLVDTMTSSSTSRTGADFAHLGKVDLDWVDLTSIAVGGSSERIDFLAGPVEWGESIDDLVATARFSLNRAWRFYNASPFVKDDAFDEHNPLANGATHLLRPMRRVRIETAIGPANMRRDNVPSWAWEVQFDGFIRAIDVTQDEVTVTCADLGVALLDSFMEPTPTGTDRKYGSSSGTAVEGQLDALIVDNAPNRYQILSIDDNGAGNAIVITTLQNGDGTINGRGRPAVWPTGTRFLITGTTNYNTAAGTTDSVASITSTTTTTVRTTAGAFAPETPASGFISGSRFVGYKGDERRGTPQLWVPVSPSWNVYEWNEPPSKSVLQALDDVASQIGWRVRYRWHEARQEFRLALYNPAAFPATALLSAGSNYTVEPVLEVRRMSQNVDDVRNVVAVEYYREAAKDPRGNRTINLTVSTDPPSIELYGRRAARINVGSDSLITRSNEASNLATRARYDLCQPVAETEVETLFDDTPMIGDLVLMVSEQASDAQAPMFFSGDTVEGSLVSLRNRVGSGVARTAIGIRNLSGFLDLPVQRGERYSEIVAQVGSLPGRGLAAPATPAAPTCSALGAINAVRHARVRWTVPAGDLNAAWLETEVHFDSSSSTFTPTSSTLTTFGGVVRGTTAIFGGFTAGVTYYCRIVSVDRMGNRSDPSSAGSFVA